MRGWGGGGVGYYSRGCWDRECSTCLESSAQSHWFSKKFRILCVKRNIYHTVSIIVKTLLHSDIKAITDGPGDVNVDVSAPNCLQ